MNQAGFPQQWIKQGYAEWDEIEVQKPDEAKLYQSYCTRSEIPYIAIRRWAHEARLGMHILIKGKKLSLEGQERLEELFNKYARWDPKKHGHRESCINAHMIYWANIPVKCLAELMPQVIAIAQQHLEPWIRD
jgi:hypothetical protein